MQFSLKCSVIWYYWSQLPHLYNPLKSYLKTVCRTFKANALQILIFLSLDNSHLRLRWYEDGVSGHTGSRSTSLVSHIPNHFPSPPPEIRTLTQSMSCLGRGRQCHKTVELNFFLPNGKQLYKDIMSRRMNVSEWCTWSARRGGPLSCSSSMAAWSPPPWWRGRPPWRTGRWRRRAGTRSRERWALNLRWMGEKQMMIELWQDTFCLSEKVLNLHHLAPWWWECLWSRKEEWRWPGPWRPSGAACRDP